MRAGVSPSGSGGRPAGPRSAGRPGAVSTSRRGSVAGAGGSTSPGAASTRDGSPSARMCVSSRSPDRGLSGTTATPASSAATTPTAVCRVGVAHRATRWAAAEASFAACAPAAEASSAWLSVWSPKRRAVWWEPAASAGNSGGMGGADTWGHYRSGGVPPGEPHTLVPSSVPIFQAPREPPCTSPTAASRSWSSGAARRRSAWRGWPSSCVTFVDLNPDFEVPVERLATWLARLDDDEDEDD